MRGGDIRVGKLWSAIERVIHRAQWDWLRAAACGPVGAVAASVACGRTNSANRRFREIPKRPESLAQIAGNWQVDSSNPWRSCSDRLAFGNMKPAPRDAHNATAPAGAVVR
jgi:hypothetical protein